MFPFIGIHWSSTVKSFSFCFSLSLLIYREGKHLISHLIVKSYAINYQNCVWKICLNRTPLTCLFTILLDSLNISSFGSEDEYILWIYCQVPENNPVEQSDLNGGTLDLSLGLKVHEGDDEPGPKGDRSSDQGRPWPEWMIESYHRGARLLCEAGHKPEEYIFKLTYDLWVNLLQYL